MADGWGGFGSVSAVPLGSVVLDNLTLQSAFRALSIPKNGNLSLEVPEAHHRCGAAQKWNYELNADFRLAIDVACLGQLLQAILLNERIAVDPGFMSRWGAHAQPINAARARVVLPDIAKQIEGVIVPLRYEDSVHCERLAGASVEALNYSRMPEFREYLRELSLHGVDGAFIEITNGYFRTGYSDPSSLPSFNLGDGRDDPFALLATRDKAGYSARRLSALESVIRKVLDSPTARDLSIRRLFVEFVTALEGVSSDIHALARTSFARSYAHDKKTGSADIVKHMCAALYTQELANGVNASYMPHVLRNCFIRFGVVSAVPRRSDLPAPASDLRLDFMKTAEDFHQKQVKDWSDRRRIQVADVNIPFALASVLQVCDDPAVILDRAMDMRESKRARRLRRWFTDLHERAISTGDRRDDSMYIERELDRQMEIWVDTAPRNPRTEDIAISLCLVGGIPSASATRNVHFSAADMRRRRQLRFLYDLTRIAKSTPKMHLLLGNVFGSEVGRCWFRGQKVLTHFKASQSAGEHRGLLELR